MSTKRDVYNELSRILTQADLLGCAPEFCKRFEQTKHEMIEAIITDLPWEHELGPNGEASLSKLRNLIPKEE